MVLASRNTGTSMMSSGVVANQWIPVIKGVLTAVAIGIIPILVIFIPTPLFSKAVSIICGFFIWLAVWGVTDAIIHTFGMDYAKKVFDEVAQHQLGTVQ
jgi:conjugal transfer mating pair stabilization protein TraG